MMKHPRQLSLFPALKISKPGIRHSCRADVWTPDGYLRASIYRPGWNAAYATARSRFWRPGDTIKVERI